MKDKKKLKNIAKRVAKIEKSMNLGKTVEKAENEIYILTQDLSIEELLYIDEYIQKNRLL